MVMDFVSASVRAHFGSAMADRLDGMRASLTQLSRYSAASALALALDFTVYLTLSAEGLRPVLAGVLGYTAGLALHFVLSSRFVFNRASLDKTQARLLGEFALTGLAGTGTTAIVMALATGIGGLPGLTAKVMAASASFVLVYWLRCTIVFGASSQREPHIG
jgi:putative flippase GtrA